MKAHGSLSLVDKEFHGFSVPKTKEGSEINERWKKHRVKSSLCRLRNHDKAAREH
jgi:hypothetical protein